MADNKTPRRAARKPEAWRIERMEQPVPGHINEQARLSPWLMVGAIAVVVLVGALLLFFSGFPDGSLASSTLPQATRTPRPPTIVLITATPALTATPTPGPTAATVKYTVKKGDTLSTIALKFKVAVEAIREANDLRSDTIKVGDVLIIPLPTPTPPPQSSSGGTGGAAAPTATPTPLTFRTPTLIGFLKTPTLATSTTPTATPGVVLYTVKSGDTLIAIAAMFNTTAQAIMEVNKFDGPSIRAGQTISVPVGSWKPTPTVVVYLSPTATLTPQYAYPAPELTNPSDGADIAHDSAVTLQWLSVGMLDEDEYYVLHLRNASTGAEFSYQIEPDRGNSLRLDAPPPGTNGETQFAWYVIVVKSSGCGSAAPAAVQPCAVSPVSATRGFVWR